MHTRHVASALLLSIGLLLGFDRPVAAQSGPAISVKFAIDPSIGGTTNAGGTGAVNGVPVNVDSKSWTDTHSSNAPLFVVGADFPLAGIVRSLVNFEYGRVNGNSLQIGTAGTAPLIAEFDKYQFFGFEGGVRVGQPTGGYGIVTAGFRRVEAIEVSTTVTGSTAFGRSEFYDTSNVPSFGFGGGFMFGAFGVEVMAKYAGKLDPHSRAASVLPNGLASEGERWSLPISLLVRF